MPLVLCYERIGLNCKGCRKCFPPTKLLVCVGGRGPASQIELGRIKGVEPAYRPGNTKKKKSNGGRWPDVDEKIRTFNTPSNGAKSEKVPDPPLDAKNDH